MHDNCEAANYKHNPSLFVLCSMPTFKTSAKLQAQIQTPWGLCWIDFEEHWLDRHAQVSGWFQSSVDVVCAEVMELD